MRKYLAIVSVSIFILTILIMQFTIVGQVGGPIDMTVLLSGIGISILAALFSEKGWLKTTVLSLYGVLFGGYVIAVIGFAVAHM